MLALRIPKWRNSQRTPCGNRTLSTPSDNLHRELRRPTSLRTLQNKGGRNDHRLASEDKKKSWEKPMRITRRQAMVGGFGLLAAPSAHAQVEAPIPGWPSRIISWICPFAAGGGADTISRVVSAALSEHLRHRVIVDNRPGASGLIGTRAIASAAPDGYTVGLLTEVHCVSHALGQELGYDADKDFTYISQLIRVPMGMFTSGKRSQLRNLGELITFAKANPGKLTAASIGPGTPHHMAVEWLKKAAGIDVLVVNFRSIPQGIQALLSGDADMMFMGLSVAANDYVAQGSMHQVAVTTRTRLPTSPSVQTMIEQGLADFELVSWYGLVGPSGIPEPVLDLLHSKLIAALNAPETRRRIESTGAQVAPSSPPEFAALVRADTNRFKTIVALTKEN